MPDLDPAVLEVYRQTAQRKKRQMQEQVEARLERAWKAARIAAAILRDEFLATDVVVFGSLVQPELFHIRSDIDLAVWGLDEHCYFRAVGRLQGIDPEISVDLILIDDAGESLLKIILEEGVKI